MVRENKVVWKVRQNNEDSIYLVIPDFDAHQNHLGSCKNIWSLGYTPYQLNQNVWVGEPGISGFHRFLGDSCMQQNLRTISLLYFLQKLCRKTYDAIG